MARHLAQCLPVVLIPEQIAVATVRFDVIHHQIALATYCVPVGTFIDNTTSEAQHAKRML